MTIIIHLGQLYSIHQTMTSLKTSGLISRLHEINNKINKQGSKLDLLQVLLIRPDERILPYLWSDISIPYFVIKYWLKYCIRYNTRNISGSNFCKASVLY